MVQEKGAQRGSPYPEMELWWGPDAREGGLRGSRGSQGQGKWGGQGLRQVGWGIQHLCAQEGRLQESPVSGRGGSQGGDTPDVCPWDSQGSSALREIGIGVGKARNGVPGGPSAKEKERSGLWEKWDGW